jgi:hypothetical protein
VGSYDYHGGSVGSRQANASDGDCLVKPAADLLDLLNPDSNLKNGATCQGWARLAKRLAAATLQVGVFAW